MLNHLHITSLAPHQEIIINQFDTKSPFKTSLASSDLLETNLFLLISKQASLELVICAGPFPESLAVVADVLILLAWVMDCLALMLPAWVAVNQSEIKQ